MYEIHADGKTLHNPRLINEGYGVISPKVTVSISKAGTLEFIMPPNNALYDSINKLKTKVTVSQNGEEIFRGRVLNDEKDFYKQKRVSCEGQLAFLLDSIQRPYSYSGTVEGLFKKLITNHNNRVEADKQFTVGKVTVSANVSCSNSSYPNTFDEINTQIIEKTGGQLLVRKANNIYYLDLIAPTAEDGTVNTSTQTIEFGRNLMDITEYITAENIFTVLIPLGGTVGDTDEKLTITSVNGNSDCLVNSSGVSLFGYIEKTMEWSECESASELKTLGQKALDDNFKMSVSLSVRAVDLNLLDVNVAAIRLGDWVRVISVPHGLDEMFQCTKIVYDLLNPENNEYSFGAVRETFTQKQAKNNKTMKSSVSMVVSTAGAVNASVGKVNQANSNMEQIIAQMPTDYINQATFEAYKTEVDEDFSDVQSNYEDLLARVITLEGGTV